MADLTVLVPAAVAVAVIAGVAVAWLASLAARRGDALRDAQVAALLAEADGAARLLTEGAQGLVCHATASGRALLGGGGPALAALEGRLADEDQAHEAFARLRAAVAAGAPERVDLPLMPLTNGRPWGAVHAPEWWSVAVRPVTGAGGRAFLGWTLEDITARRAIEDVLHREREDLAEFLYFTPVGLYSADADGSLRMVNQRLAEWLGAQPDDLTGQPLESIVAEGAVPEGEGAWRGEMTFRTRSSGTFRALVVQNTFDDAGETRTRSVVVRDGVGNGHDADGTREESGPHSAVAAADPRFRWLVDGAPQGLCLLDLEGCITDCNPAFERLTGQPRASLVDRPLADLLAPADRGGLDGLMQRVALGVLPSVQREVRLTHAPDAAADLTLAPMGSGAGVDALVAHVVDTTAQRTLEAQFAQAQKMQAMGQLAGGVAHDFNNLLTAMIGFSDLLLQRHGAGDPSFADLMQIKQNANRAANLVRQLLAFSRKQPLQPKRLDITDALTEMSHLLRRLLGERVHLTMKHGRDVGPVRVDPGQFDQVIINLAVNARDAMPEGGELIIRTRAESVTTPFHRGVEQVPAGDYTVVTVVDTGTGIPRENLARIFEPFFSTKTGTVGAGTGLGLSTVYGIIRQTGGFLFVDSVVGKGTEFTIWLPRDVEDPVEPVSPASPEASPKAAPMQVAVSAAAPVAAPTASDLTGGGVVMLVEDEDPVRVFASRALRNKGYTVIEARTAEGALDLLDARDGPVDVLVTDMVMPGMNGADLARTVRERWPDLPVVLISGYSEEAARGEIAESLDFHFLPKPFSLQQLAAKVKEVLSAGP